MLENIERISKEGRKIGVQLITGEFGEIFRIVHDIDKNVRDFHVKLRETVTLIVKREDIKKVFAL